MKNIKFKWITEDKFQLMNGEIYEFRGNIEYLRGCLIAGISIYAVEKNTNQITLVNFVNGLHDSHYTKKCFYGVPYWTTLVFDMFSDRDEFLKNHIRENTNINLSNKNTVTKVLKYLSGNKKFREFWLNKHLLEDNI